MLFVACISPEMGIAKSLAACKCGVCCCGNSDCHQCSRMNTQSTQGAAAALIGSSSPPLSCCCPSVTAEPASCSVVLVNNGTLLLYGVSLGIATCPTIPEPLQPGASVTCTVSTSTMSAPVQWYRHCRNSAPAKKGLYIHALMNNRLKLPPGRCFPLPGQVASKIVGKVWWCAGAHMHMVPAEMPCNLLCGNCQSVLKAVSPRLGNVGKPRGHTSM